MADGDLTVVGAVKEWLAIPPTQKGSDDKLQELVTSVSAEFLRAIGRVDFLQEDYTEVREGDGGDRMTLRHWPINAVSGVTVAGISVAESPDRMQTGYFIEEELDPEHRTQLCLVGTAFQDGAVVSVQYSGGYDEAPEDVRQAVTEWVAARFRGRQGQGVASQRDASGEVTAFDKEASMPLAVLAVIERYRREWPCLDKRQEDRDYRVTRISKVYTKTEVAK